MTKEDRGQNEIFWNTTLAPDDITRLFEPKVFTGWERWDREAVAEGKPKPIGEIRDDDNLLIKGNNLLALHSLKVRHAGKVKLIYIDPPYNTGNDGFRYNDKFNHSAWLTFMRNRLEVSRDLLRTDGLICVQCSHSPSNQGESPETGYLSVIMDEVFGRDNFVVNLIWKKKGNPSNTAEAIGTITESILVFAKSMDSVILNRESFERYYEFKENGVGYNLEQPVKTAQGEYERPTMTYDIETPEGTFGPPTGKRWTYGKRKMEEFVSKQKYEIKNGSFFIKKFEDDYKSGSTKIYKNLLQDLGSLKSAKDQLKNLGFSREEFESPKPEELMRHIIEMTTQKGDIVLDYHLGSGTTAAVAHKMERQYIGVEQMDYIHHLTAARLKKVIDGEKGGISRAVNWNGGGSFIFAQLAASVSTFADRINSARDIMVISEIYLDIRKSGFLRYEVNLSTSDFGDFTNLPLHDAKRLLMDCLDTNHLYVNLNSIGDTSFDISNEDASATRSFYGVEE